jgi:hypothetical protein
LAESVSQTGNRKAEEGADPSGSRGSNTKLECKTKLLILEAISIVVVVLLIT